MSTDLIKNAINLGGFNVPGPVAQPGRAPHFYQKPDLQSPGEGNEVVASSKQ